MRVLLVGLPDERERLRVQLLAEHVDVAAEFVTMSAARGSRVAADAIVVAARDGAGEETPSEPLTPREVQVLELLVEGLSNKVIAARLRISDQTVKFHAAAICGKLGAANRTDAVRKAIRRGLVAV
jgi:DNA-binding NarL/FixJ family response regulator